MTTRTKRPAATVPAALATEIRSEPRQRRSADRITKLLDTAARLIDARGIEGLTTSDVAASADSSVGVVYRYFPNIESLLNALADRNLQRYTDRLLATRSKSFQEFGNAAIDTYIELCRTEPGFRSLGFGDVIVKRFLEPRTSNHSVLARRLAEHLAANHGATLGEDLVFELEVAVEIGEALLSRAFQYDRRGEARFIERVRELVPVSL